MRAISSSGSFSAPLADLLPLLLDLRAELVGADLVHQDLDARLEHVVAPAVQIVDAQDGFQVGSAGRPRAGTSRISLAIMGVRPWPPPT